MIKRIFGLTSRKTNRKGRRPQVTAATIRSGKSKISRGKGKTCEFC